MGDHFHEHTHTIPGIVLDLVHLGPVIVLMVVEHPSQKGTVVVPINIRDLVDSGGRADMKPRMSLRRH